MTLDDLVTPDGLPSNDKPESSSAQFGSHGDYDLLDGDPDAAEKSDEEDAVRDDLRTRVSEDDLLVDSEPEEDDDEEEEDEDEELENYFLGEDVDNY